MEYRRLKEDPSVFSVGSTWNIISPMRTGCVSNPKLWNRSLEFLTRVYPPNCKNVRIYTMIKMNAYKTSWEKRRTMENIMNTQLTSPEPIKMGAIPIKIRNLRNQKRKKERIRPNSIHLCQSWQVLSYCDIHTIVKITPSDRIKF